MPDLLPSTEGRSQFLLTCDSVETVLIDRETLSELNKALIEALEGFEECERWQEFVHVAQRYLTESTETQYSQVEELEHPINSALLFLETWSDKSPDALGLSIHQIAESQKVLYSILAFSRMGGGDD
ncbi:MULTISPECIES: hypothetical protein [unclassified Microcoleus]|uniref:hypothetical protein n=1 Tax=unclassified Microcoleus TaxID=2642155 RepID=UPI002FD09A24